MKQIIKALVIGISLVVGAGCTTMQATPPEMLAAETSCFQEVAKAKIAESKRVASVQTINFTDARDYAIAKMADALAEGNKPQALSDFIPCTLTVQAFLRESGQNTRSANTLWGKIVSASAIVGGIWVTGNAIEGLTAASGTNIYGSRVTSGNVVHQGGSASSSGDGLGQYNSFGSYGLSGGQNRGNMYGDVSGSDPSSGSNSGDNAAGNTSPVIQPDN